MGWPGKSFDSWFMFLENCTVSIHLERVNTDKIIISSWCKVFSIRRSFDATNFLIMSRKSQSFKLRSSKIIIMNCMISWSWRKEIIRSKHSSRDWANSFFMALFVHYYFSIMLVINLYKSIICTYCKNITRRTKLYGCKKVIFSWFADFNNFVILIFKAINNISKNDSNLVICWPIQYIQIKVIFKLCCV